MPEKRSHGETNSAAWLHMETQTLEFVPEERDRQGHGLLTLKQMSVVLFAIVVVVLFLNIMFLLASMKWKKYFLHKLYLGVCLSKVKVWLRQEAKDFGRFIMAKTRRNRFWEENNSLKFNSNVKEEEIDKTECGYLVIGGIYRLIKNIFLLYKELSR